MLIIEGALFVGAVIGTFVLGTPIAVALAQPHRWSRAATGEPSTRTRRTDVVRAFTPLDLGVDPVRWPSERLWDLKSTLTRPDWPSKSWDDEHFGRHWKDSATPADASERGFHAMAARRHREERVVTPPTPPAVASAPVVTKSPPRRQRVEEQRRRQAQPTPVEAPRKPAPPPSPPSKAQPPDEAELEQLIASVGLAGTVQAIMQRTGWEFKDAAQYLARVRRG